MKKTLLISLISLTLSANNFQDEYKVKPGEFEIGVEAFNKKDFKTSGDIFASLMVTGDKRTLYYLGKTFGEGLGVDKDCRKALFFTFTGMKEGICDNSKLLSDWLKSGNCAKKDHEKSKKYLTKYNECLNKN